MSIIGITSIGSGVGQSVVNSCRLSELKHKLVGFGTNPMAYGAYDCDVVDSLPTIYAPNYVDALVELVKKHSLELVIPGLDDELPILSKRRGDFEALGCKVLVSDETVLKICRDKELMSKVMSKYTDTYVRSYSKDTVIKALETGEVDFPLIAKPRSGFASRGLGFLFSNEDLARISDDVVIQELAVPHSGDPHRPEFLSKLKKGVIAQVSEISIQLLTDSEGKLIGRFASYHRLNYGVPIEILPVDHPSIWQEMNKQFPILKKMGLRGPINIQGRLTDQGFKFFELNARFTGITGLRAVMGFNEVEASINSWLGLGAKVTGLAVNPRKVGIRQMTDRSVPKELNFSIEGLLDSTLRTEHNHPQKVLVTGATGQLGLNLVRTLAQRPADFSVVAVGRSPAKLKALFRDLPNVELCAIKPDFLGYDLGGVDAVVHCAFTRMQGTAGEIAESLAYTQRLFELVRKKQVAKLINISSRSVYDQSQPLPWGEATPVMPNTPYAMAKYATELMTRQVAQANAFVRATNLRMSVINGGLPGPVMIDFITKVVGRALKEHRIDLRGGTQILDVLNVADAVSAIIQLLELPPTDWSTEYNLGSGKPTSIVELAQVIKDEVEQILGEGNEVAITLTEDPSVSLQYGLDCSALQALTGWRPVNAIRQTVREVVQSMAKMKVSNDI